MTSQQEEVPTSWSNLLVRIGLNAVTHPIEYAKILIQVGHEPLAPYKSRTLWGKEALFYPSVFSYVAHIKRTDGFFGCYRGLMPKLASNICSGLAFQRVVEEIKIEELDTKNNGKEEQLNCEQKAKLFVKKTLRETAGRIVGITASQPFHVIAIRSMVEFVGNDGKYTGIFTSISVIYREEGFNGFFSGLIPRIMCDVGALWLANSVIHILNNYFVDDRDIKSYIGASVRFMASAIMYPLNVVSNCMAASGSGLLGASPPLMPIYSDWMDCYKHLKQVKGLKRGSSLLWRTYTGPIVVNFGSNIISSPSMLKKVV